MAREEHRREDLLRDARALRPRVQLEVPDDALPHRLVFAGWRGDALSLFFDEDPAYHFNAAGQLRRAFVAGRLIKAEHRRLAAMTRRRDARQTVLLRHELDAEETQTLLEALYRQLTALATALSAGRFTIQGEVPPESGSATRLQQWLDDHPRIEPAGRPHVG